MSEAEDDAAPGWEAINGALRPIYGDREPKHFATVIKWMMGGRDPLDGISVYKRTDGTRHWHYVTYGLTELYAKESEDQEVSGYGFELTFRLACKPKEKDPPVWAANMLQNLARYVFETGNTFGVGHHMNLNGPIALAEKTEITAALFAADPELPPIASPHGRVEFVQIVGITNDELEAVQAWDSTPFTEMMMESSPLLVTDLARSSILADPKTASLVAERTEREGSSMGELYASVVRWSASETTTRVTLGALAAAGLKKQLRGRLLHRKPLLVIGAGGEATNVIVIEPAETPSITIAAEGGYLQISLPPSLAREMSDTLRAERGTYRWESLPNLVIRVERSVIKDRDGNVVRTVG
jgi:hypothetical protein